MDVSRILALAVFSSACGGPLATQRAASPPPTPAEVAQKVGEAKTSTDLAVNPDAAIMADFKTRVEKYIDLHDRLAKGAAAQKDKTDAVTLNAAETALAAKIQAARAGAKQGDIFTPAIRAKFRQLLAPELKGRDGRDAKAFMQEDSPAAGTISFKVNAKYPEGQPLPAVPATVLLSLPALPSDLEYRIVGKHLLLLDTPAGLIVDYIPNAIK